MNLWMSLNLNPEVEKNCSHRNLMEILPFLLCQIFCFIRFLQQLLRDVTKGLQTKLELNKMSEETENALLKKQEENIRTISQDCTKVNTDLFQHLQ